MSNDLRPLPDVYDQAKQILDNLDTAANTRIEYSYRIKLFLDFIQQRGFNRNSYLEFKRYLQQRNDLAVSSKNKYLIVGKVYCKELHRQGILPIDITQNIKSFQQSRKHKRDGMNDEEIALIVTYLNQLPQTPHNTRLKALLSLLVLQGLRQIELVRLNVSDLDLVSGRAFVQGKGQDDKEAVDLHPETVKTLKTYLQVNKIADGALFTSTSNNSRDQRLTTKSIRNLINPILQELNISKSVHGFRHYFTTKLIQSYAGDLLTVASYTRHKNLEMLQVYNDGIKRKSDLPRFYKTFENINL